MKTEKEMEETLLTISNIITNALEKRNTEVKQAIIELREYWKDDIEPIYGQLTELLQKLGLGK